VVQPLFFPGGDIGSLAVHGTINDLSMMGANPRYLSAAFILEEGLPIATLKHVVSSMAKTAQDCGVQIVCGDTKVVDRGKGDQIFINTTGLGVIPQSVDIGPHRLIPGDRIIVSGDLGAHGMAVLSQREGLEFSGNLVSDSAPLHTIIADLLNQGVVIHCLRDLTRGGLASALHELATAAHLTMTIAESRIPIGEPVRGACEILGLDPLYVANEGRFVMFLPPENVDEALSILHTHSVSQKAVDIGHIQLSPSTSHQAPVILQTEYGTHRILDLLSGEQLPRIC
jgi:hydrogenase expression/formation protein HypE